MSPAKVAVVFALVALLALSCTFAGLYFSSKSNAAAPANCSGSGSGVVSNSSSGAEGAAALAAAQAAAAANCQRCAALLSFAHAVGVCNSTSNECKIAGCNAGYASCDGLFDNGCEAALASDVNNCGACAKRCPSYSNATARCDAGLCTVTCNATGSDECDGLAATVCETDLRSNVSNCGSCGKICPSDTNSSAACSDGTCALLCNAGFNQCAGVCKDIKTDARHCGACGAVCPTVANGAAACSASACKINCNAGLLYCAGVCTSVNNDTANCGGCGTACSNPSNTLGATCQSGQCSFAACAAGFANCNGAGIDGCEVNVKSSATNCGFCGTACASGQTCSAGACVATTG